MRGDSPLWGGLDWKKSPPESPGCRLCLSGGKSDLHPGGWGGGAKRGVFRAWSGDNPSECCLSSAADTALGVSDTSGRWREHLNSTSSSHLHPELICWKCSGSGTELDPVLWCRLFFPQVLSSATQRKQSTGYASAPSLHPGHWTRDGPWQATGLSFRQATGPSFRITVSPPPRSPTLPHPTHPESQEWVFLLGF